MNPTCTHPTLRLAICMDDMIQSVDENQERPDFVLEGAKQRQKTSILRIQHKRHIPPPGQTSDTKSRIFGGNSIENKQNAGASRSDNASKDQKPDKTEELALVAVARKPPIKSRNPLLDDGDDRPKLQPVKAITYNAQNTSRIKFSASPRPRIAADSKRRLSRFKIGGSRIPNLTKTVTKK